MRTSQTHQFEATTSAFLGPASFIRSLQSVVKLHQLYLLYFIHEVVAAVAKAQVYLTIKILKSVSSNPARGRNFFYFLILFFFYTFFLYFFICIELFIPWGKFTNHVDPLGGGEVVFVSCKKGASLQWCTVFIYQSVDAKWTNCIFCTKMWRAITIFKDINYFCNAIYICTYVKIN